MTSAVRSVNVDHLNRLVEAVRIGGELNMEKLLRVASDIGGYTPETDSHYKIDGRTSEADDIESDLPPGTSPLSKLDLGPFEVHSMV